MHQRIKLNQIYIRSNRVFPELPSSNSLPSSFLQGWATIRLYIIRKWPKNHLNNIAQLKLLTKTTWDYFHLNSISTSTYQACKKWRMLALVLKYIMIAIIIHIYQVAQWVWVCRCLTAHQHIKGTKKRPELFVTITVHTL